MTKEMLCTLIGLTVAIANQHDMHTVGLIFRYHLEGKLNVSMSKIMMCTIGETF